MENGEGIKNISDSESKNVESKVIYNQKTGEAVGIVKTKAKNMVEDIHKVMVKLKEMGAIDDKD